MLKKIYSWFGQFWKKDIWVGSQHIDLGSLKVLVHIPFHLLLGFLPALIALNIFSLFNYTQFQIVWISFVIGCTAGISIEGYQIFWQQIWVQKYDGFLQSGFDICGYVIGASFIFLFLISEGV